MSSSSLSDSSSDDDFSDFLDEIQGTIQGFMFQPKRTVVDDSDSDDHSSDPSTSASQNPRLQNSDW